MPTLQGSPEKARLASVVIDGSRKPGGGALVWKGGGSLSLLATNLKITVVAMYPSGEVELSFQEVTVSQGRGGQNRAYEPEQVCSTTPSQKLNGYQLQHFLNQKEVHTF